jgi:hypothetical protein
MMTPQDMSASPPAIVEAAPRLEWAPLPLPRPALLLLLLLLAAGPMGVVLRPAADTTGCRLHLLVVLPWGMAQAAGPMGEVLR